MHLLLKKEDHIPEKDSIVDLNQSIGKIIFLSYADTELSCISEANKKIFNEIPSLRLVNLKLLSCPLSIDKYIEKTAQYSQLIVIRVLGGANYWLYGLEKMYALSVEKKILLAVLSGDNQQDPNLLRFSNVSIDILEQLWRYLFEGGIHNAENFLHYCSFLLDRKKKKPCKFIKNTKVGLWWNNLIYSDFKKFPYFSEIQKKPVIPIIFYRALVQSGQTEPIENLSKKIQNYNIIPIPIFISSLKDDISTSYILKIFSYFVPDLVLNTTAFSVTTPGAYQPTALEIHGNMVLQVILSSSSKESWYKNLRGLISSDITMNVSLPEIDGRILSRAISFKKEKIYDEKTQCNILLHKSIDNRVEFVAELSSKWILLKNKIPFDRRIAIIIANYPSLDGRIGHGVGLDTPESVIVTLKAMKNFGYKISKIPKNGNELIKLLILGPTNFKIKNRIIKNFLSVDMYRSYFELLPKQNRREIINSWGDIENDVEIINNKFPISIIKLDNIVIGIQPERSFGMNKKEVYHSSNVVPSHSYIAFYFWLRYFYQLDAIVHMGKHGTLEWLPGKAIALSENCYPEIVLGAIPHIYPFIVNNPGEGSQAKRRSSAIIIDHMTPSLTKSENFGVLRDLENLVDEYYEANGVDFRRTSHLKKKIFNLIEVSALYDDIGIKKNDEDDISFQKLDSFLCNLKELQIRDGLHIFGKSPSGEQLINLIISIVRIPRGEGPKNSLHRAIANDLKLNFDPLNCIMTDLWIGKRPDILMKICSNLWRNYSDTVERIEKVCFALISGKISCPKTMTQTKIILTNIKKELIPLIESCGEIEIKNFLRALDGKFIEPGPSGSPTRGRQDVFPTGRNFFSLDNRSVPTLTAWEIGKHSANLLINRYFQDYGKWPTSFGLTVWGTSNMRTGGDDISQILYLLGAKPVWDELSRRVVGYKIIPLTKLCRPRIDVTLRISGFFRDAFPEQLIFLDKIFRDIGNLDESDYDNPIAMRMKRDAKDFVSLGYSQKNAFLYSGYRIFGSDPGKYGSGVQELINNGKWKTHIDLGNAWFKNSSYAYGSKSFNNGGFILKKRLSELQAVVQNQDNREHDILDSSEYYSFEGGMLSAVKSKTGVWIQSYHNDISYPENPKIHTLEEEISRIFHGRVINEKWLKGIMRHGYKGGSELAATIDCLFAFAATTKFIKNSHFDAIYQSYIKSKKIRDFLLENNPNAFSEITGRLKEAMQRNLWNSRFNSVVLDFQVENKR